MAGPSGSGAAPCGRAGRPGAVPDGADVATVVVRALAPGAGLAVSSPAAGCQTAGEAVGLVSCGGHACGVGRTGSRGIAIRGAVADRRAMADPVGLDAGDLGSTGLVGTVGGCRSLAYG